MMKKNILFRNSEGRRPFQLVENSAFVAELNYPKWYRTSQVEIQVQGKDKFTLRTRGFWLNHLELCQGGDAYWRV